MVSWLTPLLLILAAIALAGRDGSNAKPSAVPPEPPSGWIRNGPSEHAVVWAVGDGAGGPGAKSVARLVARGKPDLFLYLGDVYPMGNRNAFRTGYASTFGRLAKLTAPTPGNHDWPARARGYDPYWSAIHGRNPPSFYSLQAGGWQLIELNSEISDRSDQLIWLDAQLRARGNCRLAFWHRPRFSAGLHGDNRDMEIYWRELQGRARLVISGHDHDMQRFRSQGGLIQFVSGAGGKGHYRVKRGRAGLRFADDRRYGALRIELTPGHARLSFVDTAGRTLNSTKVACRP
jgi:Calcineurin-like phosphoesterase